MGIRLGFADVLRSKLTDAPPPVALGWREPRIASPAWVHRLEPLRAVSATFLHSRYPHTATAAPAAGGIPVEKAQAPSRRGSAASRPARSARRSQRELLAIHLLNRLGASLTGNASDEDVRSAYRRLVRESHPDRHPDADDAARAAHARKLRAILRAWEVFQGRAADAA